VGFVWTSETFACGLSQQAVEAEAAQKLLLKPVFERTEVEDPLVLILILFLPRTRVVHPISKNPCPLWWSLDGICYALSVTRVTTQQPLSGGRRCHGRRPNAGRLGGVPRSTA